VGSGSYIHATLPVHTCGWVTVPRTVSRGECIERGIQADTHAERFLGRKIARAHRAVHFRVPCRSHVLHCVHTCMHACRSPAATPTTITNRTDPGFRVGFSPWKRRDCRGPTWRARRDRLSASFRHLVSLSFSLYSSSSRDSLLSLRLTMSLRAYK